MKRIGLLLLLLIAISYLTKDYWFKKESVDQHTNTNEIVEQENSSVEENIDEYANVKQYKIINCPEIKDMTNKTLQVEINEYNKNTVDKYISEEYLENAINVKSYKEIPRGPYADWIDISCRTLRNDEIIYSQKINISMYGAGAAHPISFATSSNYSIKDGKKLSLSDLFKPDTDYLKIVTERARFYLSRDHGVDPQWIIDGTSDELSLSDFLIDSKGLTIEFDPYQVASYSEGFIEILIPKAELGPNYLY